MAIVERISLSQFAEVTKRQRQGAGKKRGKYGAVKTTLYGITFDSKAEAARYAALLAQEQQGRIAKLRRQVPYELAPAVVINGRRRPALKYLADFVYEERDGTEVVEDVKGVATDAYRIKRHLMMAVHGIAIREVK